MSCLSQTRFLTLVLKLDAAMSGACALGLLAGAGWLSRPLGLPDVFLTAIGAMLVPYCVFLLVLSARPVLPATLVWMVIAGNAIWAGASVVLMLGGWFALTVLGYAFVAAQAVAVGVFAELQFMALRRSPVIA